MWCCAREDAGLKLRPAGRRGRTVGVIVMILVTTFMLPGCTRVSPTRAASAAHVLRIADVHEPQSLDPFVAFNQADIAYDQLFCQTLVRAGGPNRVIAQLVTRVPSRANGDISADGKVITYHLRHDIRFADGVPFTARDVVFTYRALFDPRNQTASVEPYRRIARLSALDAFTVRVVLHAPWNAAVGTFFAAADFAYGILPAHAFKSTLVKGSAWEQAPFGTGAFHVVSWQRGDRIVLERNPYFRPVPRLDRIILKMLPNYETARIALVSGDVDLAPILPVAVDGFRARSDFRVAINYLNGFVALTLQTTRAPTDNLHLRRAIAAAIDLRTLGKMTLGLGHPVRSFLAPPIVTWHQSHSDPPYRYDQVRARHELDAAGWPLVNGVRRKGGRALALVYAVNAEDQSDVRRATAIQAQLAAIDVPVELKPYGTALYTASDGPVRGGRFNLVSGSEIAGDDPEQSAIVTTCAQAHGGINYARYCSPLNEQLFSDQATTSSEARRYRDFDAMEALAIDDVTMVPLFQYMYIVAVSQRVTNYQTDYLEYPVEPQRWDVAPPQP